MKRIYILFCTILMSTGCYLSAQNEWSPAETNPIPLHYISRSVKIAPDSSIWLQSFIYLDNNEDDISYLHKSNDFGKTWETDTFPNSRIAGDIFPFDSNHAIITLYPEGLFQTWDGGKTWDKVNIMDYDPIIIHFFSRNDGFVLAVDTSNYSPFPTFLLTSDGGVNWKVVGDSLWLQPEGTSLPNQVEGEYFWRVFSWNSSYSVVGDTIAVAMNTGNILISEDKGYNWERINTPLNTRGYMITSMAMKTNQEIAISGNYSNETWLQSKAPLFYSTHDGGANWDAGTPLVTPAAMKYLNGTEGTLIMTGHMETGGYGGSGTAASLDFGETWCLLDSRESNLWGMDFLNDSVGVGISAGWLNETTVESSVYTWNLNAASVAEKVVMNCPTNINVQSAESLVTLYPNPVNDQLTINTNGEFLHSNILMEILSVDGKIVSSGTHWCNGELSVPTQILHPGMYLLRITGKENMVVKRFIKE